MKWGNRDKRTPEQFIVGEVPNKFDELFESDIWERPYDFPVPPAPLLIDIEPTNNCNFSCKFCNRSIMKRKTGMMTMDTYKRVMGQVMGKVFHIKFSRWGEPFLNPHIYEMFHLAKKQLMKVHVTTNGSLLDIDRLQDVDTVYFSMQGLDSKSYQDLRGNSLEKLRTKIEALTKKKERPHVCISTSVLNENKAQVKAFIDDWSKIVDKVQVGRTSFTWVDKKDYIAKQTFKLRSDPCRDVRLRMSIDWNGDVTPCCTDFDGYLTVGNINNNTLEELWNNPRMQNIRKQIGEKNFGHNPLCARCTQQW